MQDAPAFVLDGRAPRRHARRLPIASSITVLLAAVSCGSEDAKPSRASTEPAAPPATVLDRDSPTALISSFRAAALAWDTHAMYDCFEASERSYEAFVEELAAARDEILPCMRNAELGATHANRDGTLSFGLLHCPSKSGHLTGRMIQLEDGSWRLRRM